jgi:hypothetical protein
VALVVSTVHRLYAAELNSIEAARRVVERALGIRLEWHDSSYQDQYLRFTRPDGELELHANWQAAEGAWLEPDHRDVAYLLRASAPVSQERWLEALDREPQLRLLRRSEY